MISQNTCPLPPSAAVAIRRLAADGRLAATVADASNERRLELSRAAFEIVWPLVFHRHTSPLERRRRHHWCARSVRDLEPGCHDLFLDDVYSVVAYLLAFAKAPIINLEGWISSRIAAAVVDGHRRRRGLLGAQQRPRVPEWLAAALQNDRWLIELARRILEWVGVPTLAGAETWPLGSWSEMRAEVTGEWARSFDGRTLTVEIELVCATMRRVRPAWFERYVEGPLGVKQRAVLWLCSDGDLTAVADQRDVDGELLERAGLVLDYVADQTATGTDPDYAVRVALLRMFPVDNHGAGVVAAVLDDPARASRLTATVRDILTAQQLSSAC